MRSRTSSSLVDVYFPCCSQPCQTNLYYSTTELSICLGHAAANSAAFKSLITSLCVSWKHCSLLPIQPHSSHLSQVFVARGSTVRCGQFSRIQVTYRKPLSLVEAMFSPSVLLPPSNPRHYSIYLPYDITNSSSTSRLVVHYLYLEASFGIASVTVSTSRLPSRTIRQARRPRRSRCAPRGPRLQASRQEMR
jgi:hypothetical protein